LKVKMRMIARCSIWKVFACTFTKMKRHIMTRRPDRYPWILYFWIAYFVKKYRYCFIISPFSIDEKQEAKSQTYRQPISSEVMSPWSLSNEY
jgi:hypothetical protein